MGQSTFGKLWLIFWKNLILRKRQYIVSALEIILPTIFAILIAYIRSRLPSEVSGTEDSIFPIVGEEEILLSLRSDIFGYMGGSNATIGYSPNNNETKSFVEDKLSAKLLSIECNYCDDTTESFINWIPFPNEKELEAFVAEEGINYDYNKPRMSIGLVFNNGLEDLSQKISYKIRLVDRFSDTKEIMPWLIFASQDCGGWSEEYKSSGFSGLQILIDKLLTEEVLPITTNYTINTQIFPCPAGDGFDFNQIYFILLPQFLVLSFIFIVPSLVRGIVSEKETGIKELMKMSGLPNWMHWLGWMLNSLVVLIISVTIVVVVFFIPFNSESGAVLKNSDPSLWWFVLIIYVIWATTYCFLISSLFERPTLATTVGIVVWLITYYGVALPLEPSYSNLSLGSKLLLCLSPNMGLHYALKVLSGFEAKKDVGAQWKYIGKAVNGVDTLTLAHVLMMLIVSSILYTLLAMYFECVLPTKYGVRKPWYFIFLPSTYGFGKADKGSKESVSFLRSQVDSEEGKSFETFSTDLKVGMEIIKLRKEFGGKVAVNDVSVKAYEGQIFCLLGHNGAGKTTTMSVLTGLLAPSGGTALINDKDIRTEMSELREDLGLCPQNNLLFEKLSVAEHLKFFGMVKGLSSSEASSQLPDLIKKLQLEEKTNVLAMALSGGQKRRLSLGCAIIGNSKILFLDECSSGLDPEARRVIWDLLMEIREGRTIILTTHFLEEADVLGDRVAIMAAGRVQCCGSPAFLKKYYGTGYTLSISMKGNGSPEMILQQVQTHFPSAFIKSLERHENDDVIEVAITISSQESTARFPPMFGSILSSKDVLNVGIQLTTMDEVFLKVDELGHNSSENSNGHSTSNGVTLEPTTIGKDLRATGFELVLQQFWGLFLKKILYCMRRWKLTLSQMVLPVLLLIGAVLIINTSYGVRDNTPPLTMSLSSYKDQIVLYTNSPEGENLGSMYSRVVGSSAKKVEGNLSIELLKVSKESEDIYFQRHVVAAELSDTQINAMYSSIPKHSSPLSINLATNAMLRHLGNGDSTTTIEVINHPLDGSSKIFNAASLNPTFAEVAPFVFGILVSIGISLLAASYIVMPIEERKCQGKQLQLMTGINPFIYWGSSLLWDYFVLLLVATVMIACLFIFEEYKGFTNNGGAGVVFLIIAVYGVGAVSFSYLLSLLAQTPAGGFSLVTIIHIITGTAFALGVFILQDDISMANSARIIAWIGRLFPTYGISKSLMTYSRLSTGNSRCNALTQDIKDVLCKPFESDFSYSSYQSCCDNCEEIGGTNCFKPKSYLVWEYREEDSQYYSSPVVSGIALELVCMLVMSLFYFGVLMLIEFGYMKRLLNKVWKQTSLDFFTNCDDDNVKSEAERVADMVQRNATSEDSFVVSNLCKSYGAFSAVSKLTFGVHHGECFGLLGVNGAGKTTSFKMLTGEELISTGNSWIENKSLQSDRKSFIQNIGYCPQFDGIIGVMTGIENLELFARLRGIKNSEVSSSARNWLDRFGLLESGNVQCHKYSGGMKRRLSAAIALIGDPPIIFLDEPTSGVDPASRRQFWKIISSLRDSGRSIILTSHSMEECEVLCQRLGIMVNGEFQCLGRVPHLKNKFAQGYSLTIRLKPEALNNQPEAFLTALIYAVTTKFNPCALKDHHQNIMQFHIQSMEMRLDNVFETMENIKFQFASYIEEYSIQQTTLEEVFLSFARKQYSEVREVANISAFRRAVSCIFGC